MAELQKTNICCLDLNKECLDYFMSLGLNVFEGTLGSVLSFEWDKVEGYRAFVRPDFNIPSNLHEYHVFVADTANSRQRIYKQEEHEFKKIDIEDPKRFSCEPPVNTLDIQPLGGHYLSELLKKESKHNRIEIVFIGPYEEVTYKTDHLKYHSPKTVGTFSNYGTWGILPGNEKYGERVMVEDNRLSRLLFEGREHLVNYFCTFNIPYKREGDKKISDSHYLSILNNEHGECVSYVYFGDDKNAKFVLPQLENKLGVIRDLFENIIFTYFSEFFPDIEAKRWIHKPEYELPEEIAIREKITTKREEYEKEIAELEKQAKEACNKYTFLKQLLTSTGTELVSAVKKYLEWLGFENVVDQDLLIGEGKNKEEDLNLEYGGRKVLIEVKGINHTSKDSECSQVDKIVLRRTKQLKTSDVHGVYIVNNQKNIEPLSRKVPPFNDNQISDAENLGRTMIYTAQLFALFSDIENGYVTKKDSREAFLKPGLADFHVKYRLLGIPYNYYQGNTVICLELGGDKVALGDTLYYKDNLQRLVGLNVESIEQNKAAVDYAKTGKTAIKVGKKVPKGAAILIKYDLI